MSAFESSGGRLIDPVCGINVPTDGEFRTFYRGNVYIFCSGLCLSEFQENPEKFIAAPAEYFKCPRHTGVRQVEPGSCPQCGMPLEAVRPKWVCPYHPQALHDKPGVCPIYGMPLIPEPPGRFYCCILHRDVKQLEAGKCPKCGMTLQPVWAPVVHLRTEWLCPMHPNLLSSSPGTCPRCGMKMDPRVLPEEKA
jgi:Cu+-exporting ATPase